MHESVAVKTLALESHQLPRLPSPPAIGGRSKSLKLHQLRQNEFNPISQRWIRPMMEQRVENGALEVLNTSSPNVRGVQAHLS